MRRQTREDRQAGFTFIEIMVAMMIVLILIGGASFMYIRYVGRARVVGAKNQIEAFSIALNGYYLDCGRFPSTDQGLQALWEKPILEPVPSQWSGPYLNKEVPKDPWTHEYAYQNPGPSGLPFAVRSFGADGVEGGEGNDQDLLSWREE